MCGHTNHKKYAYRAVDAKGEAYIIVRNENPVSNKVPFGGLLFSLEHDGSVDMLRLATDLLNCFSGS